MQDKPDPPRKTYGFKPREFERANNVPSSPPSEAPPTPPAPDPGILPVDTGRIDVRDLIRAGAGDGPQLGHNTEVNRANEVHEVLRENYRRDLAAGGYDLGELDDSKRRRRIRHYWIAIVLFDTPFALFAYKVGHDAAIPFV